MIKYYINNPRIINSICNNPELIRWKTEDESGQKEVIIGPNNRIGHGLETYYSLKVLKSTEE